MLKVYGIPISVHTRKVLVAARAKKVPFESVPVRPWPEASATARANSAPLA